MNGPKVLSIALVVSRLNSPVLFSFWCSSWIHFTYTPLGLSIFIVSRPPSPFVKRTIDVVLWHPSSNDANLAFPDAFNQITQLLEDSYFIFRLLHAQNLH
jgi:hypothetical protein